MKFKQMYVLSIRLEFGVCRLRVDSSVSSKLLCSRTFYELAVHMIRNSQDIDNLFRLNGTETQSA